MLYTKPAFHILFSLFYERRAVKCDSFHCCNGFGLSILGFLTCPLSSRRHRRNRDSSFPRHKNHSHRTQTYTTHTTALQSSHVSHFHPLPYFHALIFVFFGGTICLILGTVPIFPGASPSSSPPPTNVLRKKHSTGLWTSFS